MSEPLKTCSKCGREFPATPEYFHKDKNGKFGLRPDCKECCRKRGLEYNQTNKEKRREYSREWRKNNPEKLREYHQNNREKKREYSREYYQNNRESVLERQKEYNQNNRDKVSEYMREYHQNNRDKVSEYMREYGKEYYQNNKEKVLANVRNYRARLLEAEGFHTAHDIMKKYRLQQGRCFYCGCDLDYKFEVDHFYPLSKGGSNDPSNLVIACQTCNRSKSDKMPEEFIASLPNRVWS